MSSFKRRPKKVTKSNDHSFKTLDIKHQEKMHSFEQKDDELPKLKDSLNKSRKKLQIIEAMDPSLYTANDIKNRASLKTLINTLDDEIKHIEQNIDEKDYILGTLDILVDYYTYMDKHMDVNTNAINDNPTDFKKYKQLSRANLLDQYNSLIGENYKKSKKSPIRICQKCSIEKVLHLTEGSYVCTNCGETELVTMDSDQPNYKDPLPDNPTYAYQRKNHFILGDGNSKLLPKCRGYRKTNCVPFYCFDINKLNPFQLISEQRVFC